MPVEDKVKSRRKPSLELDPENEVRDGVSELRSDNDGKMAMVSKKDGNIIPSVHSRKGAPNKPSHGKKELRDHGKKLSRIEDDDTQSVTVTRPDSIKNLAANDLRISSNESTKSVPKPSAGKVSLNTKDKDIDVRIKVNPKAAPKITTTKKPIKLEQNIKIVPLQPTVRPLSGTTKSKRYGISGYINNLSIIPII